MSDAFNFSILSSARDNAPLAAALNWSDFVGFLREQAEQPRQRRDKLACGAFVPGLFNGRRSNANVATLSGIAADIDIAASDPGYATFDQWRERLAAMNVAAIIYTTTKSRAAHHRLRIVMRYADAITPDRHLAAWHAVNAKLGGVMDPATKEPARISFLPAAWEGDYRDDRTSAWTAIPDGFNAIEALGGGEPILSSEELANLPIEPAARAVRQRMCVSGDGEHQRGLDVNFKRPADHLRAFLSDIDRSPYITARMRADAALPGATGGRVFAFMLRAARRAQRSRHPIDAEVLADLAANFERTDLHRFPAADLVRQAARVLRMVSDDAEPGGTRPSTQERTE